MGEIAGEVGVMTLTLYSLFPPMFLCFSDRSVEVLKRLMAEHDKDDSGTIDANEFSMIMVRH